MSHSPILTGISGALLILLTAFAVEATTIRVRGNMTSDVLASGDHPTLGRIGNRTTEHPGDTGPLPGSAGIAVRAQDLTANAPGAGSELHLFGTASLGSLSITGSASAFAVDPQGVGASAGGGILTEWRADLTILAPGLPTGTLVDLMATIAITAEGSLSGNGDNFIEARYRFPNLGAGTSVDQICRDFNSNCNLFQQVPLRGRVGTTYSISSSLSLGVSAHANTTIGPLDSAATVNAGNTSLLYLDVLTPGASHVLDDGSTLPRYVPEPPASLLVALCTAFALRTPWRVGRAEALVAAQET